MKRGRGLYLKGLTINGHNLGIALALESLIVVLVAKMLVFLEAFVKLPAPAKFNDAGRLDHFDRSLDYLYNGLPTCLYSYRCILLYVNAL